MEVKIEPSWKKVLQKEFGEEYFSKLTEFVKSEYKKTTVYPPAKFIFNAFELTPFDEVKVVILGQDPYHGVNQANGLAFSVNDGVVTPPSLVNIYKEIESDLGQKTINKNGNLENWAKQGVLMLNATLTVQAHMAGSHQNKGWEQFTDAVVKILSDQKENLVFILWGGYAQKKGSVIDQSKHLVITSTHPSPFSAYNGFFGSKPFSQTNAYLIFNDKKPINW
ncbi:MAG: uracil-DNA glycosylase [Candidatus Shapirobacteria bacterium]|nr:uracil-DNA glycosylase [Candidatus Shapirobacteria bacterium]MDD3003276.1 uracil-DNA glycosylase [Candidatus Shapirobacteria bacterium]MDD4382567.1 uracil-DNA glycosylase [Candidatus Shapirobacteria bacterium]